MTVRLNLRDWQARAYRDGATALLVPMRKVVLDAKYPHTAHPICSPGDTLLLREAFYCDLVPFDKGPLPKTEPATGHSLYTIHDSLYYRSDGTCCEQIPECCCAEVGRVRWRLARTMPTWAIRWRPTCRAVRAVRIEDLTLDELGAISPTQAIPIPDPGEWAWLIEVDR